MVGGAWIARTSIESGKISQASVTKEPFPRKKERLGASIFRAFASSTGSELVLLVKRSDSIGALSKDLHLHAHR
jgi:hypothetical protein